MDNLTVAYIAALPRLSAFPDQAATGFDKLAPLVKPRLTRGYHLPMNPSPAKRLLWSVARRCPNCGSGNVFRSYMHQRDNCPTCGLRLDRGERDFFIGAYTINLIVAEMLVFFGGLAILRLTWPDVPWDALMYGLGALMIIAPIALYPFSRQVWLATDLILRPSEPDDFPRVILPPRRASRLQTASRDSSPSTGDTTT